MSAISILDFPVTIDAAQSNAPSLMASGLLSLAGPNLVLSTGQQDHTFDMFAVVTILKQTEKA